MDHKKNNVELEIEQETINPNTHLTEQGIYFINQEIELSTLTPICQDLLLKHLSPKWEADIQIYINSPGGVMSEAWALVDLLDLVKMDIQTIGIGLTCSAGAIILSSGTKGKRFITQNTEIMIHEFEASMDGNFSSLKANSRSLELEQFRHIRFWTNHCNLQTEQEVRQKLLNGKNFFLSPEEALELGIVDHILENPKRKRTCDILKRKKKNVRT